MLGLSPENERKLAFLSQQAQRSLLGVLQGESPSTVTDGLDRADEFLNALENIFHESEIRLPETVPAAVRRLLEERLHYFQPKNVPETADEIKKAKAVIEQLRGGGSVAQDEIVACIDFIREVICVRVRRRLPVRDTEASTSGHGS